MLGGAPVAPELVRRAREQLGVAVTIGFGQTEASPYLTHTRPDDPNPRWAETVGPPLPGTEIRISDPATGLLLPTGVVGEICARGPGLMTGYFDDTEGTAQALDTDGWLHTGDLGSLDGDGYLRVQGRLRDMIIRGGENIYPREIEDLLLTHPDVADVSVVGIPDAELGEQVAAFVRPAAGRGVDHDRLTAFCREHLAVYKTPRIWETVEDFPQTASGKIQKFVLRERYLASREGSDASPAAGMTVTT